MQLTKEEATLIIEMITKQVPNCAVWVFGSRAKNQADPYSDLDLLLKDDQQIPLLTYSKLVEDFNNSDIPFKVEIADWYRITPEFQNHIQEHWQPLINNDQ